MSETPSEDFQDRRQTPSGRPPSGAERRQFVDSHESMPDDVRELTEAVDAYKVSRRRRFITLAEVLDVLKGLGYHK